MKTNKKLSFTDYICKLSSIPRFAGSHLMQDQSGCDHAFRVTMISLVIAEDYNLKNPKQKVSREEILLKALFHDVEESIMGDIPSPVKYRTEKFREAVREEEEFSMKTIVEDLPQKKEYYKLWKNAKKSLSGKIIKIADKLEGFIKIHDEINLGNSGLNDAYMETAIWFRENQKLISKFPKALELIKAYEIDVLEDELKIRESL